MIVPVGLLLIQINFWYGYKPLQVGERIIVKAKTDNLIELKNENVSLVVPKGLEAQTPPLRIPMNSEINWRLLATQKGRYEIKMRIDGQEVTKSVIVSDQSERLSLLRHASGFWQALFYPGERKIPASSHLRSIEVLYKPKLMSVLGWEIHWIFVYFVLSIFFGLALKRVFRVQI